LNMQLRLSCERMSAFNGITLQFVVIFYLLTFSQALPALNMHVDPLAATFRLASRSTEDLQVGAARTVVADSDTLVALTVPNSVNDRKLEEVLVAKMKSINPDYEQTNTSYIRIVNPSHISTAEPVIVPTPVPTFEPASVETGSPSHSPSLTPTAPPTDSPTLSPTESRVCCTTSSPTFPPTLEPTSAPTPEPTREPTPEPTYEPTRVPTPLPSAVPTPVPTVDPTTATPAPTPAPTFEPTLDPTDEPTREPTPDPTEVPTLMPTLVPTDAPTREPTAVPTETPTPAPTSTPTEVPTPSPTRTPTEEPTPAPTSTPTRVPTPVPTTNEPSREPTDTPTVPPTTATPAPTREPTREPTANPTEDPTREPTRVPTDEPTRLPTPTPTEVPTPAPTPNPTEPPTPLPTRYPTRNPTKSPTEWPSLLITPVPTFEPTSYPTLWPSTEVPTLNPSQVPTRGPVTPTPTTEEPSSVPIVTPHPTLVPTTRVPTIVPTTLTSNAPTPAPSRVPYVDCLEVCEALDQLNRLIRDPHLNNPAAEELCHTQAQKLAAVTSTAHASTIKTLGANITNILAANSAVTSLAAWNGSTSHPCTHNCTAWKLGQLGGAWWMNHNTYGHNGHTAPPADAVTPPGWGRISEDLQVAASTPSPAAGCAGGTNCQGTRTVYTMVRATSASDAKKLAKEVTAAAQELGSSYVTNTWDPNLPSAAPSTTLDLIRQEIHNVLGGSGTAPPGHLVQSKPLNTQLQSLIKKEVDKQDKSSDTAAVVLGVLLGLVLLAGFVGVGYYVQQQRASHQLQGQMIANAARGKSADNSPTGLAVA